MRTDPTYIQNLAWPLNQITGEMQSLTNHLSSGLAVSSLSDNPLAAAQSSMLASQISRDDTFSQTSSSQTSLMQVADSTLGDVVNELTSAISLAVKAVNGTNNSANNSSIAQELSGIRDQILSLANTSYQGSYLFSGSQNVQPFTLDSTTDPATVTYNGDSNIRSIETPNGQSLQTNLPGSSVFGSGTTGVLGALNQMISDLTNGAPASTLSSDSSALTTSLNQVSSQRTVIDNSLSRLKSATTYNATEETQLKAQQSTLVAADQATIATQLASSEAQYQALLSVMSGLQKQSLFDFLH
jgi:flagellar hook-associated protein 3 FlgL